MENMNLGKCCICEKQDDSVRNMMTLDKKSPEAKGGWGCFVCNLEAHGAVAVLCDECLDKFVAEKVEIKFACLGYPGENRRIEVEKLTENFEHNMSKHPEEAQEQIPINIIEPADDWDVVVCQKCQAIKAVVEGKCADCGETICIVCGCTDSHACPGGCFWMRPNVCSQCDALSAD